MPAAGIDVAAAMELTEEAITLRAAWVGNDKVCEFRLGTERGRGIEACRLHQLLHVVDVEHVLRETEMPRIVGEMTESDREVAGVKVGQDIL